MNHSLGYVITALLSGGGIGALVLLLKTPSDVRKAKAETGKTGVEAAATLADIALELVEPLRTGLREATAEVAELKAEVTELRDHVAIYHLVYGPLTTEQINAARERN